MKKVGHIIFGFFSIDVSNIFLINGRAFTMKKLSMKGAKFYVK